MLFDEEEADETYYKLINYSVDADKCTDTGYNLNCDLNTQIYFDSVKTFTTQHFVDKYGKYKNTRSSSFDPTNINLGVINISDRKHTNAEIVWKSKIFRSYSSDDIKIQFKDEELEGYTWHYLTKGKSKININFED